MFIIILKNVYIFIYYINLVYKKLRAKGMGKPSTRCAGKKI